MSRCAALFFCLLLLPAHANLDETVDQCVARYGRPVGYSEANAKLPFGTVVYTAGGYQLVVFLLKNKEVGARVSKGDKSAFTDAEMLNIINADALPGAPWTATTSNDPGSLRWVRSDHATALYDKEKHVIIITSDEMAVAMHEAQQAAASAPPTPAPTTNSAPAAPADSGKSPP